MEGVDDSVDMVSRITSNVIYAFQNGNYHLQVRSIFASVSEKLFSSVVSEEWEYNIEDFVALFGFVDAATLQRRCDEDAFGGWWEVQWRPSDNHKSDKQSFKVQTRIFDTKSVLNWIQSVL